jgi:hypothetical protein
MMYHSIAKITLGALLVTLAGCKDLSVPSAPARSEPSGPINPPDSPPTSSVVGIFDRISPSFLDGGQRYVLYADSTFNLQYDGIPTFPGIYSRADSTITFKFKAPSVVAAWLAGGIFRGDLLVVKYNDVMLLSDFEDGAYMRSTSESSNVKGE